MQHKVYCMTKVFLTIIISLLILCPLSAQNKRALLIGISTYNPQNIKSNFSWSNIHGSNDVELIKNTLSRKGFVINSIKGNKATAKNIRKAFSKLEEYSKNGEIIYIHFSGHGQAVEDMNGDEQDEWDESIIPIDAAIAYSPNGYKGQNHILDDELHQYFVSLRKKVGRTGMVYAVIDACHAGTAYRGDEIEDTTFVRGTDNGFSFTGKRYTPRIDKRGNISVEKSNDMSDICIIEACRAYEVNTEIKENGKYYGPLSFYVNKILTSIPISRDTNWTSKVRNLMDKDKRLIKQHIVIESTK